MKFIWDNTSIHKASIIKNWLGKNGIPLRDWLLYSLDLSTIEHDWAKLKMYTYMAYPDFKLFNETNV